MIKMPIIVARYGGTSELPAKVIEAVRILQKSPQSEKLCLLLAKILERSMLTGEMPAAAMVWAASVETDIDNKNLLEFLQNDPLIADCTALGATLVHTSQAEWFRFMGVKTALVEAAVKHRSLAAAIENIGEKVTPEDKALLQKNFAELRSSAQSGSICEPSMEAVANTFGLGCSLPGKP